MKISGGWSKIPHAITDAMPHMTLPELACTLLLVRETYGWHRPWARLTRADFCKLTPIKSRATVGAALKAVEARGFFHRSSKPSLWLVSEKDQPPQSTDPPPTRTISSGCETWGLLDETITPEDNSSIESFNSIAEKFFGSTS
jgi:hypothetical protein